jgi:hypothetical protein
MDTLKNYARTLRFLTLTTACAITALPSQAAFFVPKPGAPDLAGAAEMGRSIAISGNYVAAAAKQENALLLGESNIFGSIGQQGVVYLFEGPALTPIRTYQFPGAALFGKLFGDNISLSNQWLAVAARNSGPNLFDKPQEIFIVRKGPQGWPSCPQVQGVIDCTSLVSDNGALASSPLTRITLPESPPGTVASKDLNLAISDRYLAVAKLGLSMLYIYEFRADRNAWELVYEQDNRDPDATGNLASGTVMKFSGDRLLVSSPGDSQSTTPGFVELFKRDNQNGNWSRQTQYLFGSDFNANLFGKWADISENRLVVAGELPNPNDSSSRHTIIASYSLNNQELKPRFEQSILVPHTIAGISLSNQHLLVASSVNEKLLDVYKLDGNNRFALAEQLDSNHLIRNGNLPGVHAIVAEGDRVILGFAGADKLNGALIVDAISNIDSCKIPGNLIANCSFDQPNATNWRLYSQQGASGFASFDGGQMRNTLWWGGWMTWHIQARTSVSLPSAGNYRLSFKAKADAPRSVEISLGHNGSQDGNWRSHHLRSVQLTPQMQTFEFVLPNTPQDINAVLDFNLGNAGTSAVTLDSVKLTLEP